MMTKRVRPFNVPRQSTYRQTPFPNLNCSVHPQVGRSGFYEFGKLAPVDFIPTHLCRYSPSRLSGFNKSKKITSAIHFFQPDREFEKFWRSPDTSLTDLANYQFRAVLSPDFSMLPDWPRWKRLYNHGRKVELSAFWQRAGLDVIPVVRWGDSSDFDFCFDGIPKRATVAIATAYHWKLQTDVWVAGLEELMVVLEPTNLLIYGNAFHVPPTVRQMPDLTIREYPRNLSA